ncbi:hypothetical protein [Dyella dinghuensis]|nr:hypothetical protein [Dyella dinghuensis]
MPAAKPIHVCSRLIGNQGENMSVNNPYDAPKSSVEDVVEHSAALEQVAGGQKLIIYSILLYFVGMAMNRSFAGGLTLVCVLASLALSITGIIRLCNGMGYSTLNKVFLIISLFLPLVNLIVLVSLSIRATSRLKEAGYKVGLLGARR